MQRRAPRSGTPVTANMLLIAHGVSMGAMVHHVRVRPVGDRRSARGFAAHPDGDVNQVRIGLSRVWWERVQALGPGAEVLVEPNQSNGFEGGVFQVVAVEPPSHGRGGIAASVAVIGRRMQQRRPASHETLERMDDRSD